MTKHFLIVVFVFLGFVLKAQNSPAGVVQFKEEKHLKNIVQLTDGGDNAEAYWSFDNQSVIFQSNNPAWGLSCDQIFIMEAKKGAGYGDKPKMISNGKGRTTCSYFMPDNQSVIFSSTHEASEDCPAEVPRSEGYIWMMHPEFNVYQADLDGNIIKKLTDTPYYDAEATVSPKGDKIVFTSMRTGDPELFIMNIDGTDVRQVINTLGYDGGAFFTPDGEKLIFRANHPETEEEIAEYKALIAENKVRPTEMELFICNVDGSDLKQITNLGGANWAPFMHPSGEKVLFSSNHKSPKGYPFNIFMINLDGTGLEQITFDNMFDSFPMFSPDGKKLLFSSNRNNGGTRDTNVFMAEWVD